MTGSYRSPLHRQTRPSSYHPVLHLPTSHRSHPEPPKISKYTRNNVRRRNGCCPQAEGCAAFEVLSEIGLLVASGARGVRRDPAAAPTPPGPRRDNPAPIRGMNFILISTLSAATPFGCARDTLSFRHIRFNSQSQQEPV